MAEAAILIGGKVKRTTNLSGLGFNHGSGFLTRFTFKEVTYVHTTKNAFRIEDQDQTDASGGYYNEAEFLKYLVKKISLSDIVDDKLDFRLLEDAKAEDTVVVRKLKIETPYNICYEMNDITWRYVLNSQTLKDDGDTINIPADALEIGKIGQINTTATAFYNRNIQLVLNSPSINKDTAAYFVTLIAIQIHRIGNDIFSNFYDTQQFGAYISLQNFAWANTVSINPALEDIEQYYYSVTAFYNRFYSNQVLIQGATDETKLYWLAYVLSENALAVVPVADRLMVLETIAKGTILGGISALIRDVNEEEFVIKIVKSIADNDASEFLDGLTSFRTFEEKKVITLFQSLYDKTNDRGIGAENLKILIDEVYSLWLKSTYYPYTGDSVKEDLINPTHYSTKPIALDYQSGSFILNNSNYDFAFAGTDIAVTEEVFTTNGDVASSYTRHIGDYGIYQSVTIKNSDSNTDSVRFQTINIGGNQKAVVPIFYLKYIDDKKETENIVTVLELTFDLATSFVGIGNVRHLRHINRLGRIALGLETATPGTILLTIEFGQGVGGLIEISASLGDIFLNYYEDYDSTYCNVNSASYNAAKCDFYTDLSHVFLALQLVTGTGAVDYVAKRQLRTASRKILAKPIPDDFNAEALTLLRKLAGDIDQMLLDFRARLYNRYQTYETPIWTRINNATSPGGMGIDKRNEFLDEFADAPVEVLDDLNAENGDLIDYWREIDDFKGDRARIEYLRSYKLIVNNISLLEHVHLGHPRIKLRQRNGVPRNSEGVITGSHNLSVLRNPPPPPLAPGEMSWQIPPPVQNSNTSKPSLGYQQGVVQRNMHDLVDPRTNTLFVKGDGGVIVTKNNVYFPESYSTKRINQELAFAREKIDLSNPFDVKINSLGEYSFYYRSPATDGHMLELIFHGINSNPRMATLNTVYPLNF